MSSRPKTSLEPPPPLNMSKPATFLSLPRELRDEVYTYLLSTEYNKHEYGEPRFVNHRRPLLSMRILTNHAQFSMRLPYTYHFHTSILYINRQINNEATETFYINNLFVRISCGVDHIANRYISSVRQIDAKDAEDAKAQKSEHHVMEIDLLSKGEVSDDHRKNKFIVTCNELPALCRSLLSMDTEFQGTLDSIELRLTISDEVRNDRDRAEDGEATESHGKSKSYPTGGDLSAEGRVVSMNNKIRLMSPRVRRLLEPLRELHSIRDPQIMGPLTEEYKAEVITDISKHLPSNQDRFDNVLTTFGEAINSFNFGNFYSSISAFRNTLDELNDAKHLHRGIVHTKFTTGPYAGFIIWVAYKKLRITVWTNLVRAYLKIGDIDTAEKWLLCVFRVFIHERWDFWTMAPGEHDFATVFHLESQIQEERERMGHSVCRLYHLPTTIVALKEKLRREPGNSLLAQRLRKRRLELTRENEIFVLMNMAARLNSE